MQVAQNVIKDMLGKIEDPKLREVYGSIISGQVIAQVRCMSEDIVETRTFPLFDEDNAPILFKSGKRKGEQKTEDKKIVVRTGCAGRVIAYIDESRRVDETEPVANANEFYNGHYSSGLEGSRVRLDGQLGFRCYCGNNSVLCEEEKGVITPARPTSDDLQKIADRLSRRKGNEYMPNKGKTNIDGFIIEELKV